MDYQLKKILLAFIMITGLSACDRDENVGEQIGDSVEELGEDIEDAAEN